jgi:hypothetical protein
LPVDFDPIRVASCKHLSGINRPSGGPDILADLSNELTSMAREAIAELYDLPRHLDQRIASFDEKIEREDRESVSRR